MTINYGKREAGGLTAANPGDTLYIPFASYNDSGNNEALTGLAVSDIEIFKNGDVTPRATDSGYSILTDTGQYGDRVGLYRVRVQIYNTADDTGFFDAGSQYHIAIDSVTIDGKTVRFFPAVFEIGRQRVDVREFNDTGINDRLARIQSDVDTGLRTHISDVDTGLHDALADVDTGLRDYIDNTDTGLRAFIDDIDTGLRDTLADYDTGVRDYITNLDTGIMARFNTLAEDTGGVNVTSLFGDTGAAVHLRQLMANGFHDTGINQQLSNILSDTDTGIQSGVTIAGFSDTGVNERLTAIESKTGSLTFTVSGHVDANVQSVNDTAVQGTGAPGDEWRP